MNLPVIVVGCGGHSHVLIETLRLRDTPVLGVIDPVIPEGIPGPFGLRVLGGDDSLDRFRRNEVRLVNGIGSTSSMGAREAVYRRCFEKGFRFIAVIHPSAVISSSAQLAEDAQVMAGCVIQSGTAVGVNSIINTRASIDHDCKVGMSVHIAPSVTLSGSVTVGDCTHIGTGAVVIQNISIGSHSLIAAGAIVYRNIPDGARLIPGQARTPCQMSKKL